MKIVKELLATGIEHLTESYYDNGQLYERREWNEDRTGTYLIESYYPNGQLDERREWNESRTYTDLIESYHENGQHKHLSAR
jgi:antitoxin component YwqK of YwqJK toxin-antitoxin module